MNRSLVIAVLIISTISMTIALSSLILRLVRVNPMQSSNEWKMEHVTPNTSLVNKTAEYYNSPELIHNFIELKYLYISEQNDTWSYPEDLLKTYNETGWIKGDCEDIALLEVSLLRAIGIPSDSIRVVIFTYPTTTGEGIHAGVEYWRDQKWRLLRLQDPIGFWTKQTLYPEENMVFAFNDKLWWDG